MSMAANTEVRKVHAHTTGVPNSYLSFRRTPSSVVSTAQWRNSRMDKMKTVACMAWRNTSALHFVPNISICGLNLVFIVLD